MDCQNGWQDRDRLMVYIQKHFKELRRPLFRGTLGNFGTGAIAPCKQIGVFPLVPQPSQLVHGLVWHTSHCKGLSKGLFALAFPMGLCVMPGQGFLQFKLNCYGPGSRIDDDKALKGFERPSWAL